MFTFADAIKKLKVDPGLKKMLDSSASQIAEQQKQRAKTEKNFRGLTTDDSCAKVVSEDVSL